VLKAYLFYLEICRICWLKFEQCFIFLKYIFKAIAENDLIGYITAFGVRKKLEFAVILRSIYTVQHKNYKFVFLFFA